MSAESSEGDRDVLDRPDVAAEWTDGRILDWLRSGFRSVAEAALPSQIRFAFDGVEIDPESEPIGQVAGIILEGDMPGLPAAWQIEEMLQVYLVSDQAAEETVPFLTGLWQLLSALDVEPSIAATARRFLQRMRPAAIADEGLVRAVASAVAASEPVKNQQISFFDYLKEEFAHVWGHDFTLTAVDLAFNKAADDRARGDASAASPAQTWEEVKDRWREELRNILGEGGRTSRALQLLVARQRGLDPGSTSAEALRLELESEPSQASNRWNISFDATMDIEQLEAELA